MTPLDVALLTATVATAIFTGWAVWQRWRYTPRPLWIAPSHPRVSAYTRDGVEGSQFSWDIQNRGDAAAHDVRVFLRDASSGSWRELERSDIALVEPGESTTVWIEVEVARGAYAWNAETMQYEDNREFGSVPEHAQLRWRQHPNLARVKRRQIALPPRQG